ncbi:hypothetical protein ACFOSV_13835 [Algoriphagus namhaensis]|uniref:DUF1640 domain-containing protein n=1 Tax=Algoriphagus namhaensis TaxID=915353 RepID=A0ABV8ATI9_9BACT
MNDKIEKLREARYLIENRGLTDMSEKELLMTIAESSMATRKMLKNWTNFIVGINIAGLILAILYFSQL